MRNAALILVTLVLAALVSYGTAYMTKAPHTDQAGSGQKGESVYERVLKTQTLRCGYAYNAPLLSKNAETGELEGLLVDIMEEIGRVTGLEIVWETEINWGSIAADLSAGKIDMFCAGQWASAPRGMMMKQSEPLFFTALEVYTHAETTRYDDNWALLNDPSTTFAVWEGTPLDDVVDKQFPKAKKYYAGSMAVSEADMFELIKYKKADVMLSFQPPVLHYKRQNPGVLKRLAPERPVRVYANVMAVKMEEHKLHSLINSAIGEIKHSGTLDKILDRYLKNYKDGFMKPARLYRSPGNE